MLLKSSFAFCFSWQEKKRKTVNQVTVKNESCIWVMVQVDLSQQHLGDTSEDCRCFPFSRCFSAASNAWNLKVEALSRHSSRGVYTEHNSTRDLQHTGDEIDGQRFPPQPQEWNVTQLGGRIYIIQKHIYQVTLIIMECIQRCFSLQWDFCSSYLSNQP